MIDLYIFKNALKDLTRPRRLLVALFLVVLPSLMILIARTTAPTGGFRPEAAYNKIEELLVFGYLLVILAVVNGTGVLSQEIEQKTITYLLTRPVPRWRILLMKFLAAILAVTVTVWLASVLMAVCASGVGGLTESRLGRDLLILPVGAFAYGSLFLLLATLFNRSLMIGLLFAFGWESWVPYLPIYAKRLSLMTYLRVLAPHPEPGAEAVVQASPLLDLGVISTPLAWTVLFVCSALALSLALLAFTRREYVPRDDAE